MMIQMLLLDIAIDIAFQALYIGIGEKAPVVNKAFDIAPIVLP